MDAEIDGQIVRALKLSRGQRGGFEEIYCYSAATIFLLLRRAEEFKTELLVDRAAQSLNNILRFHAFLSVDTWTRPVRADLDSYYTVLSLAQIPGNWQESTAKALLSRLSDLSFGSEIGTARTHHVGLSSPDDLGIKPFNKEMLEIFTEGVKEYANLSLYQELFLSAIRRIKSRERHFAIIDAESAVEVCIGELLRKVMLSRGSSEDNVDAAFTSRLAGVEQRIEQLDRFAKAQTTSGMQFGNSTEWREWKSTLAKLRHAVVHHGLREISFEDAKRAVIAGMRASIFLESMLSDFAPPLRWGPAFASLVNVQESAGKVSRLFVG